MIPILIIHTVGNQTRHDNILQQFSLQSTKYEYEIIPAVMNPGMARMGIAQSHKKCVAIAKERGYDQVTIIEDDILFLSPHSLELYEQVVGSIDIDWDLCFAGVYSGEIIEVPGKLWGRIEDKVSGLQCYTVNSKFYDTFLTADDQYNIDWYLSEVLKAKSICCWPFLAIQQPGYHSYNTGKKENYNDALHFKYKFIK